MKKGVIAVSLLLLTAAIGGGGYYLWENGYINWNAESSDETVYVTAVSTLMGNDQGTLNRFSGVVEPQSTIEVALDSGRSVKELAVKEGDEVKAGQLLFEYDLSSIESDLQQAQLDLERLQNEALSLTEQIATLEKEKKSAKQDAQLSYTIEIETNKMNLKKNEYDQKSKQAEIEKLQSATGNTEVRSEINGIIQKINTSKMSSSSDSDVNDYLESSSIYSDSSSNSNAFITILSLGSYRVKGTVNELNMNDVTPGIPVIVRSRVDESITWTGTMGSIDMEAASTNNSSSYYGYDSGSNGSSSYSFYVELDSSEDLMLGQHVFIEKNEGQMETKTGLWLSDYFIVDADQEEAYVWIADDKNRLRKQVVTLGGHDDDLLEYEILDGITEDTLIAFPTSTLSEGMKTVKGTGEQTMEAMFYGEDLDYSYDYDDTEEYYDEYGEIFDENGEVIYEFEDIDESGMVFEDDGADMNIAEEGDMSEWEDFSDEYVEEFDEYLSDDMTSMDDMLLEDAG